jgi:NAD(P)-dependent dehydrogenase (short-subunit alcohol dehydrogenase family)
VRTIVDRFSAKRAVVTGASKGIGRATALRLASEGARVGLIARNEDSLEEVAAEIRSTGGECLVLPADCSNEDEVRIAFDRAAGQWGGLDIVVSNAGIELLDDDRPVDQLPLPVWEKLLATNLTGQFLTCKHGARHLLQGGGGAIVCLGSNCGFLGIAAGEPAYSASKAGVFAMMRVMANDYARSAIRVNMVVPGVIDTPMNAPLAADQDLQDLWLAGVPMRRMGKADEIASAILWLASDDASYVTGAAIVVDGGQSAI